MGAFALLDVATYCDGYDFTTDTNNAMLAMDAEAKDATVFRERWTRIVGGLKKVNYDLKGWWQSAASQAVDPQSFPHLGTTERVFTVVPNEAQPTSPVSILGVERVYMFQGRNTRYVPFGGTVGDVASFELSTQGSSGVGAVQGLLVRSPASVSATGALGATLDTLGFGVSATQFLYATFHVFTAGTTITVQVQSDDNTGFTTPTTVATIGPITTSSGTWMTPVAGTITDRYLRLNVSAITGTFTVAAAMGIR